MPLVTISDAGLREKIAPFQAQLKCREKADGKFEFLDVGRIDLYTINGIRRQVGLLTQQRDIGESPNHLAVHTDSESVSTIILPDNIDVHTIFSEECISNIHHYFNGAVRICIEGNNIRIEAEEPALSASILRIAIADLLDANALSATSVHMSAAVSQMMNQRRHCVSVPKTVLLQQLGLKLKDDEISEALRAFGYTGVKITEEEISVGTPYFRVDITSQSDVIEDLFLYYLDRIHAADTLKMVPSSHGSSREFDRVFELNERLSLMGYKEVRLPSLLRRSNIKDPHSIGPAAIDQKGKPNLVLRKSLFHSLLSYECGRQHIKLPHKIFEVGSVNGAEGDRTHLGVISADQRIDINDIFSVLHHTLSTSFGQNISLTHGTDDRLDEGGLKVISADQIIGILGVVSNEFAKKYKQRTRTAFAEVSLLTPVS